jgi:hypothetical protein
MAVFALLAEAAVAAPRAEAVALTGEAAVRAPRPCGAAFFSAGAFPKPPALFAVAAFFIACPLVISPFWGAASVFDPPTFLAGAPFATLFFEPNAAASAFLRAAAGNGVFTLAAAAPVPVLAMESSRHTFQLKTVSTR